MSQPPSKFVVVKSHLHVTNVSSDQKLENIIVNTAEEMKVLLLKTQRNAERMKVLELKEAKAGPRNFCPKIVNMNITKSLWTRGPG